MKSIVVASSCACIVTSMAWSIAVMVFAEPPPALAEESPRVRELEGVVQELQRTVADMRTKVRHLEEPEVWRMEEPEEEPAAPPALDRSGELLTAVQQKTGEITALEKRVGGIEEYLRYGGDFKPTEPEPEVIANVADVQNLGDVRWRFNQIQAERFKIFLGNQFPKEGTRIQLTSPIINQTVNEWVRGRVMLSTGELIQDTEPDNSGDNDTVD